MYSAPPQLLPHLPPGQLLSCRPLYSQRLNRTQSTLDIHLVPYIFGGLPQNLKGFLFCPQMNVELVNRELTVDPDAELGSGVQTKWSLAGLRSCLLRRPEQGGEESGGVRVCEASSVPGAVAGSYSPGSYPDLAMVLGKFPPLSEPQLSQV